MNWFWFEKKKVPVKRWESPERLFLIWSGIIWFLFLLSGVRGRGLVQWYRSGDISSISGERNRLAISSAWFDSHLWHAVDQLLKLVEIYSANDRDRSTDERLQQVLRFLAQEWDDWIDSVPEQYRWIFSLITSWAYFEEDIISLLGFNSPQTYLVILQNTAESRPNGWFFGSFAVVKVLNAKIADIQIRDSYILDYEQKNVSVEGPERLLQYLPHRDVHFVGANKIWFTYLDGNHIKRLYEKVYPWEEIRAVVFLRTDMFEQMIPWFTEQQRERQFTNAATDLIRWSDKFWKKEKYVNEVSSIIQNNKTELLKSAIRILPDLIKQGSINIYPSKVSVSGGDYGGWLEGWLRQENLTTRFEKDRAYSWEANTSYNKIDNFISKMIRISNNKGDIWYDGPEDIIDLAWLPLWEWNFDITYRLEIPREYRNYMLKLERGYGVELTDREKHILALNPIRESRGLLHLSNEFDILSIGWDIISWRDFKTPIPTHTAWYMVGIEFDGWSAQVNISVEKK